MDKCWICKTILTSKTTIGGGYHINCKVCGEYIISDSLLACSDDKYDSYKYILSAYLRERQIKPNFESLLKTEILLSSNWKQIIDDNKYKTMFEKQIAICLKHFKHHLSSPIEEGRIIAEKDYPEGYCKNEADFINLLNYLDKEGYIRAINIKSNERVMEAHQIMGHNVNPVGLFNIFLEKKGLEINTNETYEISEITKREIFDQLQINNINWYGKLSEIDFLGRIYNLSEMPSTDPRFKDASGDIYQHTENNDDWEAGWVLKDERFKVINGSDQTFTKFICEMIHPIVRPNAEEVELIVNLFNKSLDNDNWELCVVKIISKKPIYSARRKDIKISKLKFKRLERNSPVPITSELDICFLKKSNWDDYYYKTTFSLYYTGEKKKPSFIGRIKIMKKGMSDGHVVIPEEFATLTDEYCSLGWDQDYYEELMTLGSATVEQILTALRDCVNDKEIFQTFKNEEVMKKSLLRDITTRNVEESFFNILRGDAKLTPYNFTFTITDNKKVKIDVTVIPDSTPPTNIHVLIGRNGTGKTRLLSGITDAFIKNIDSTSDYSIKGEIFFIGEDKDSGRFANMVAVVFSLFDNFKPISNNDKYKYIGLKNNNGFKNLDELNNEFISSLKICLKSVKKSRWVEAINILSSDPCFAELELDQIAEKNDECINEIFENYKKLSSGHKIVLLTLTRLVELVDDRTLVIIDEPENHLHPPLLASFIRALSNLLIQRNGVAILATHSPVVLQEVPKTCVNIIYRTGKCITIEKPEIETFGENIGTLTREVFQLEVTESGFHKMISTKIANQQVPKEQQYDCLLEEFNENIGSEGKAIARALIHDRKKRR